MKKALHSIKSKLALVGIVIAATAVGGITTAFVSAAIPDSGGTIHGCYKNKNGSLSVIDPSAGGSCTSKETALNWSQNEKPEAYGHITGTYDADTNTWSYQTDNGRLSGVSSIQYVPDSEDSGATDACITANFEPKNISLTGGNVFAPVVAVRNTGLNPENNGWSSARANEACGTTGANAFFYGVGPDNWFVLN